MKPFDLPEDGSTPSPRSRRDWLEKRLRKFNRDLSAQAREVKFHLMGRSPLHFFRGTDHLFWADLGESRLLKRFGGGKATRVWISGDLHFDNFGSFTDPTGRLVFDLNDFDESVLADFQFDLWRLGVSLVLAGREKGSSSRAIQGLVEACCWGYWRELKSCRWYRNIPFEPWDSWQASGALRRFLDQVSKTLGPAHMLSRWTTIRKGVPRFKTKDNPDLEPLSPKILGRLREALERYAKRLKPWPSSKPRVFEVLDLARRLNAGIGSEGVKRFYSLVRVEAGEKDPFRILDIKRQGEPSPWKYLPRKSRQKIRKAFGGDGALRVVGASRALGLRPDPWSGTLEISGKGYSVRERSPFKAHFPEQEMDADTAFQMGAILARAHCRAKKTFAKRAFESIKGRNSKFRKLVLEVSRAYADQVESDHREFIAAQRA